MYDYDKALELAKFHQVEPILDLIHWSENYGWNDPSNPLIAFYAIAQIEELDYQISDMAIYGYVEIGLIGDALTCYAKRPNDVTDFLLKLQQWEDEGREDF